MQHLFSKVLFCLCLLSLLTSCGDQTPPSSNTAPVRTAVQTRIKIYTHRYLPAEQSFYQQFTLRTGIGVDIQLLQRSDMLDGLRNIDISDADLLLLPDLYIAHKVYQNNLLQPFLSGQIDKNVANRFLDLQGFWMGITRTTLGAIYRRERPVPNGLLNYTNLIEPSLEGQITMAHPDSSSFPVVVAGMIAGLGERGTRLWLERLQQALVTPPSGNDYQQIERVLAGEAAIALVDISAFMRYRHSGNPEHFKLGSALGLSIPVDAGLNNYYNLTVACLPAQPPHRDQAIQFLEFITGTEIQNAYAEALIEYPVNGYATPSDHLMPIEGLPQGKTAPEDAENQLETARRLIRETFGM